MYIGERGARRLRCRAAPVLDAALQDGSAVGRGEDDTRAQVWRARVPIVERGGAGRTTLLYFLVGQCMFHVYGAWPRGRVLAGAAPLSLLNTGLNFLARWRSSGELGLGEIGDAPPDAATARPRENSFNRYLVQSLQMRRPRGAVGHFSRFARFGAHLTRGTGGTFYGFSIFDPKVPHLSRKDPPVPAGAPAPRCGRSQ